MAASSLQSVTTSKALFNSNLFYLRAGTPAEQALQEASTFLASAKDIVCVLQNQNQSDLPYALAQLVEMAKVLIDATLSGAMKSEGGAV